MFTLSCETLSPNGKKCKNQIPEQDTSVGESEENLSGSEEKSVKMNSENIYMGQKSPPKQKDCNVMGASAPGHSGPSGLEATANIAEVQGTSGGVQELILQQLKRVNDHLDAVEEKVDGRRCRSSHKDSKLSSLSCYNNK